MATIRNIFPLTRLGLVLTIVLHAAAAITSEYTAMYFRLPKTIEQGGHAIILILLLIVYALAARRILQGQTLQPRHLVLVLLLSASPYLINYATQSSDLYAYIAYAEISHYSNPYLAGPVSLNGDNPILHGIWERWLPYPAPYGPLWMLLTKGIGALRASLVAQLLLFKILSAVAFAATIAILQRWRASVLTTVIILNPIFVIEYVGDGHNDSVFILFLVASLVTIGKPMLSGMWLALSMATKHVSLILSPLVLAAYIRMREYRQAAFLSSTMALTLVIIYKLFWVGMQTFDGVRSMGLYFFGVPLFFPQKIFIALLLRFQPTLTNLEAFRIAAILGVIIFVVILCILIWKVWRGKISLNLGVFLCLSAFILFGLQWVQPWYLTWLLVLAAFLTHKQGLRTMIIVSFIWFVCMYTTY